jgi:hypothetical protein
MPESQRLESDRLAQEQKRQARKFQKRPHPLVALITQQPQPEFFVGLGTGEDIPACLRCEGKVGALGGGVPGRDAWACEARPLLAHSLPSSPLSILSWPTDLPNHPLL